MTKTLKSHAIDPEEALRVATQVAPNLPPATVAPDRPDQPAMLSMRFRESTLNSLADKAAADGLTQKQVLALALAAVGVKVSPAALEDRPMPRRRGARP